MSKNKFVQTEIDSELYSILKIISMKEKKSIKKIVREAIIEYVSKYKKKLEDDSIFKLIGSIELDETVLSEKDEWRM
ncbi:MAG: hypothetical protein ACP6IU_11010 [Candidatus Asgardarchaeia archaeon]